MTGPASSATVLCPAHSVDVIRELLLWPSGGDTTLGIERFVSGSNHRSGPPQRNAKDTEIKNPCIKNPKMSRFSPLKP